MELKETEKIDKYQDLAKELRNCGRSKQELRLAARGTIPEGLVGHLESIGMNLDVPQIKKTALLGTARILRRVLYY